MGWRRHLAAAIGLCLISVPAGAREVAGWLEWAVLAPEGIWLPAKLDTGADTTSLGAAQIRRVTVEGREFIAFRLQGNDAPDLWLQRPLVRFARIKRQGLPPEYRPVVRMHVCLMGIRKEVEVTLADRSSYRYPLLVGRNFLSGDLQVDTTRVFSGAPSCDAGGVHLASPVP